MGAQTQNPQTEKARALEGRVPLRRSFWMFCILLAGFILRSIYLDLKPVHFDEGINGHFVQQIWHDGFYRYDPTNFHGPLYFYILALTERIFGWGVAPFRFVTGLINLSAVAVVGMHRRFIGRTAIFAALILALSPAFVFYSRYSIHESLFILAPVRFS
jgi:predicted membrane-bound mannosyltransferase